MILLGLARPLSQARACERVASALSCWQLLTYMILLGLARPLSQARACERVASALSVAGCYLRI